MSDLLLRGGAMAAAVPAFSASAWFGWAQERPPAGWKIPLAVGSVGGCCSRPQRARSRG
ncbi:hypothetical protein NI17_002770 [Thermobifida halotolerans]|uniref:Uncharacterized protein n=1 Tax=Thermobifida halotolerans TaxID=483545 RepID=A0AA97M4D6_9ACTN|nr:hypothetical protein [Thermobifida halotolerans]UOE20189.1 hypothetical protein NI17_002770 [Thermobifida halotolerans]